MNGEEVLTILRRNQGELRARGVRRVALFGSLARGEGDADSDIDILIELSPDARLDLFAYVGLKKFIAGLFSGPVDVVDVDALKPHVRRPAAADAIYAF
jgi:predicted nucleotidyltransferase